MRICSVWNCTQSVHKNTLCKEHFEKILSEKGRAYPDVTGRKKGQLNGYRVIHTYKNRHKILVSYEDYEYLNQFEWQVQTKRTAQPIVFRNSNVDERQQQGIGLHRFMLTELTGDDTKPRIMYINRDKLDFRRENIGFILNLNK